MHQSIKIIILLLLSAKLFATEYTPPIVFTQAEFVNNTTTRIPFKVIDQLIIVEVEILDKSGNFIIDTGSETLILNNVHFKAPKKYLDSGKETNGVHGSLENVKEKYLEELRIHNLNLEQLNADVIDLSHFEKVKKIELLGIIGYSVLKDFEVFIDMHLNQITLTRTDKKGNHLSDKVYAETIQDSIDFKLKQHTIVVDAYVGDQKVKFGIDTAAEYNQINKDIDSEILEYFYPSRELKLTGASGKKKKVLAGKLYRVSLNDSIYLGPMKTVLTDLKHMKSAFSTKLDGILGFEFFAQKRTIINYKKRKLYFIKSPIIKP
ncbi:aspartyl protease family protein [Winogradskyella sp. SYSU M77433]|uniref:aspartyl protease family protein n=1 Tax=Winogradskyella sp. SYSU M77433 TaxID=3042722 RepID=UPI00247FEBB8|nr:aspartyl protease family protein [Winogradskyella sp. SYSU M77433]MDH7914372.1 aspartyl protease family protein [Winogradskyella sp. SYSU M77433]